MSSLLQSRKCLVLNKGWTPVGTVTLQRAIIMLFSTYEDNQPKAKIIDHETYQTFSWDDWSKLRPLMTDEALVGASVNFKIPEIILLTRYEKMPKPKVHFSRRTLYKRDNNMCQYCGCKPGSEELSIDHVVPRSHGGKTTWENCVLACVKCNSKKANRTPKQAGMIPLKKAEKPQLHLFRFDTLKPVKSWTAFLGEAYWNVGIGDED